MPVNHLAFQDVKELQAVVLEHRKHVPIFRQRDEIRLDNNASGIRADVAEEIVLVAGAGTATVDVEPIITFSTLL